MYTPDGDNGPGGMGWPQLALGDGLESNMWLFSTLRVEYIKMGRDTRESINYRGRDSSECECKNGRKVSHSMNHFDEN